MHIMTDEFISAESLTQRVAHRLFDMFDPCFREIDTIYAVDSGSQTASLHACLEALSIPSPKIAKPRKLDELFYNLSVGSDNKQQSLLNVSPRHVDYPREWDSGVSTILVIPHRIARYMTELALEHRIASDAERWIESVMLVPSDLDDGIVHSVHFLSVDVWITDDGDVLAGVLYGYQFRSELLSKVDDLVSVLEYYAELRGMVPVFSGVASSYLSSVLQAHRSHLPANAALQNGHSDGVANGHTKGPTNGHGHVHVKGLETSVFTSPILESFDHSRYTLVIPSPISSVKLSGALLFTILNLCKRCISEASSNEYETQFAFAGYSTVSSTTICFARLYRTCLSTFSFSFKDCEHSIGEVERFLCEYSRSALSLEPEIVVGSHSSPVHQRARKMVRQLIASHVKKMSKDGRSDSCNRNRSSSSSSSSLSELHASDASFAAHEVSEADPLVGEMSWFWCSAQSGRSLTTVAGDLVKFVNSCVRHIHTDGPSEALFFCDERLRISVVVDALDPALPSLKAMKGKDSFAEFVCSPNLIFGFYAIFSKTASELLELQADEMDLARPSPLEDGDTDEFAALKSQHFDLASFASAFNLDPGALAYVPPSFAALVVPRRVALCSSAQLFLVSRVFLGNRKAVATLDPFMIVTKVLDLTVNANVSHVVFQQDMDISLVWNSMTPFIREQMAIKVAFECPKALLGVLLIMDIVSDEVPHDSVAQRVQHHIGDSSLAVDAEEGRQLALFIQSQQWEL
eukprot:ANDGO_04920.mRNA.1 hypothetical protein